MARPSKTPASWVAALVIPLLAAAWAWAHTAPPAIAPTGQPATGAPAPVDKEEAVENVDTIEDVTASATAVPAAELTWSKILGRLHPAAVHFPVGWVILLTLWETFVILARRKELEAVGLDLGVGAVLSTLPAVVTGLLRARELPADPGTLDQVGDHRNVMLAATAVTVSAVLLRLYRRQGPLAGSQRAAYMALLALASVLLAIGGHWGGKLVFGDNYLPF